ncbi:MAG TPA: hypothetical protein VGR44_08995 [Methylomirabilota bacterium]|jgi:fatty-acyl-CoA synthase|nr:hypothetical protein [Methylomirabilota bacterium]
MELGPALTLGEMLDRSALTSEEMVAFANGKIADFKVSKYVEIVDRFPLTGSGKVQKYKQKVYAVERYGLKEPA